MRAVIEPSVISGVMSAPKSKSMAVRMILASIFADVRVRDVELSEDVLSAFRAVQALGVAAEVHGPRGSGAVVNGSTGVGLNHFTLGLYDLTLRRPDRFPPFAQVNAGGSATVARMLVPMLAALGIEGVVDGDSSLRRRPMRGLVISMRDSGAEVEATGGERLPLRVKGRLNPSGLRVVGLESSQHVSGFAYALSAMGGGKLVASEVPSVSYVELTLWLLEKMGFRTELLPLSFPSLRSSASSWPLPSPRSFQLVVVDQGTGSEEFAAGDGGVSDAEGNREAGPRRARSATRRVLDAEVPGDYLISAFYAAASSLGGGTLTIRGLYPGLPFFGDHSVVEAFARLGAPSEFLGAEEREAGGGRYESPSECPSENDAVEEWSEGGGWNGAGRDRGISASADTAFAAGESHEVDHGAKGWLGSWRVGPIELGGAAGESAVSSQRGQPSFNANLEDSPDMVLSLAAFAAVKGVRFEGVGRLRFKESDRLKGLVEVVRAFGLRAELSSGALTLGPGKLRRADVVCPSDHRLAMLASVLCSLAGGSVGSAECVNKSDPAFWRRYEELGGEIRWAR